jgi:hypothetical protein
MPVILLALLLTLTAQAKEKARPPSTGLCAPDAFRNEWLEVTYRRFCPKVDVKKLQFELEKESHQIMMSSSFLQELVHKGPKDCSKPWTVTIECGGGANFTYTHRCERQKNSRVSCKQLSSK